jgi:hypothetical protein
MKSISVTQYSLCKLSIYEYDDHYIILTIFLKNSLLIWHIWHNIIIKNNNKKLI